MLGSPPGSAAAVRATIAPLAEGGGWWLPPNYSVHGGAMDQLFYWIFGLTMITMVGVFAFMLYFMVKYRHRPGRRKGVYTHGNTKLEMVWTLIPAVILIFVAVITKRVWDNYRYSPTDKDPNLARILVVGEQFKWNVVYPGPDGKLGRYVVYPKTSDLKWPEVPPGSDPYEWNTTAPGPAFLPEAEARKKLNEFVQTRNPLGKDFSDPNGKDDDWETALGRPVYVPKGRPVEISLSSKDVIHDFFLPNYRVKLDAVPGMRGLIYFTPNPPKTSGEYEKETLRAVPLAELEQAVSTARKEEWILAAPIEGAALPPDVGTDALFGGRYYKKVKKKKETIARIGLPVATPMIADLKEAGFTAVQAYRPKYWDLVCEELCGAGHTTMGGQLIVLSPQEYHDRFEKPKDAAPVADATNAAGVAAASVPASPTVHLP